MRVCRKKTPPQITGKTQKLLFSATRREKAADCEKRSISAQNELERRKGREPTPP